MERKFKDIDLGTTPLAKEPSVEFASSDAAYADCDVDGGDFRIPAEYLVRLRKKFPELFDESYKPLCPHTREQWAEYDKRTQYMMENKMYGSAEEFDKEMKEDFPWLFS